MARQKKQQPALTAEDIDNGLQAVIRAHEAKAKEHQDAMRALNDCVQQLYAQIQEQDKAYCKHTDAAERLRKASV